jgi:undecaprenyl-diphosphatase
MSGNFFPEWLEQSDERLFTFINRDLSASWADPIMHLASHHWFWMPVYLWLVYRFIRRYGRRSWLPLLLAISAFGLADSISSRIMKPVFKRERPFLNQELQARLPDGPAGSKYGFVSSHAANVFAVYTLSILMLGYRRGKAALLLAIAGVVAYSRVYLGVHYPLDVLCGGLFGAALAYVLFVLFRKQLKPLP